MRADMAAGVTKKWWAMAMYNIGFGIWTGTRVIDTPSALNWHVHCATEIELLFLRG